MHLRPIEQKMGLKLKEMRPFKKSGSLKTCHSALETEANVCNNLGIPASAGMTF